MIKKIKAVIHEPYSRWYLIKFEDGSFKETYRTYKYVEKFMVEHEPVQIKFGRYGYYKKEVSGV